jgi:hypothetical protein
MQLCRAVVLVPAARSYGAFCRCGLRAVGVATTFFVSFDEPCLDPCATTAQSCTATVSYENHIMLTTSLQVTGETGAEVCNGSCQIRETSCDLVIDTPGTYEVTLGGGRSAEAVLPVQAATQLFGDRNCLQQ